RFFSSASAPEQQPQPRPYQGVRVKEPVKELLKRKRGNVHNSSATAAATVVLPHQPLPPYCPMGNVPLTLCVCCREGCAGLGLILSCFPGQPCIDMEVAAPAVPVPDEGALASGWIPQPSPTSLQPLPQWSTYPDYVSHEAVSCPYSADMYMQPVCPSYTLVGPSSVLTYTSQPLLTNFAVSPEHQGVTAPSPPFQQEPW
ncbi:OBF1 factor, partial [Neodrepanis coruscans]|nr:OBF1 factor [Neodrepanis coruscans]